MNDLAFLVLRAQFAEDLKVGKALAAEKWPTATPGARAGWAWRYACEKGAEFVNQAAFGLLTPAIDGGEHE